ncbi:phage portal protein [Hephaestia caeni]|nr:phage portal protein [Hephaestia caeni]
MSFLLGAPPSASPRAMAATPGEGVLITSPADLEAALRDGNLSASGAAVTPETAMRVAVVFRCVSLISGVAATLPMQIKRRVDDRTRVNATDVPMWSVLNRRPNRWQKPAQFKRMMQAHVLLRGNAYALKVRDVRGRVMALIPLHPDRVRVEQLDDLSLRYTWTRKDGRQTAFAQEDILHLFKLTFDGFRGVTPITYARESIGASLTMERHGATVFKNGANVSSALKHPKKLTEEAHARLRADMQEFRTGGARDGETIILEEGMDWVRMGMTAVDAQWIEARKLSRSDIGMVYGVPPHMYGDTEKSTSWGTGIEQQTQGFVTFGVEDDFTMWEEGVTVDCLDAPADDGLYMRIKRGALIKGDIKTRYTAYQIGRNGGWLSKNDIRGLEDMNPIEGGDDYDAPLNSNAAVKIGGGTGKEDDDDA